ncbi:MAG: aldehyde dehydrogenase family protein [Actinomycetota bacterium]|nr:aldehyde dehydrogenase family protein [Actinomycetota bacterium]
MTAQTGGPGAQFPVARSYPSFINGAYIKPDPDAETLDLENPSTAERYGTVHCASLEQVHAAVETAHQAQRSWWSMDPAKRTRRLTVWASMLVESAEEIAALDIESVGRVRREAIGDVVKSAGQIEFWAHKGPQLFRRTERSHVVDHLFLTCPEPVGVAALLLPGNVPSRMFLAHSSVALGCGNAVIAKPADYSPSSALRIAELAISAGLPPGLVNVVTGSATTGAALVAHEGVGGLSFTGSTATGRRVATVAAARFAKVALELGGKSPQLVFPDANLDAACEAIIWSVCSNAGQICTAGTRALVHEEVYDAVLSRLVELARRVRVGNPDDDATHVGPLASRRQLEKVTTLVDSGKKQATLVLGGEPVSDRPGYFFQPTIFADVPPTADVFQEEVFGPVLCVTPFKDEEHAISLANHSQYALASNVWTTDLRRAFRVADRIDAGTVWCGTSRLGDPHMPLRAAQKSGGSHYRGLVDVFTREKLVAVSMRDEDFGPHWALGAGAED